MKDLLKAKIFISAFLISYFAFFGITVLLLDIKRDGFGVGSFDHGFPFIHYYSTCFGGDYDLLGLVGNIVFALFLSFVIGMGLSSVAAKVSSPEFRAKWYL